MTLLICLLGFFLSSPDTVKIWQTEANQIAADPLGQYYIASAGSLIKYDPKGDSVYSWSEPKTGQVSIMDTHDPMRILVYQKDFNLLRFLNNRLAPLADPISLDNLGVTFPMALAISRQGGFWVLDGSTRRIKLIDKQLKTILESEVLDISSDQESPPCQLIESGDQLYLHIQGKEIQVFDLFGNRLKRLPLKTPAFDIVGDQILLVFSDKIQLWKDWVTPEKTLFQLSDAGIREACYTRNKLLIMTDDKVLLIGL